MMHDSARAQYYFANGQRVIGRLERTEQNYAEQNEYVAVWEI